MYEFLSFYHYNRVRLSMFMVQCLDLGCKHTIFSPLAKELTSFCATANTRHAEASWNPTESLLPQYAITLLYDTSPYNSITLVIPAFLWCCFTSQSSQISTSTGYKKQPMSSHYNANHGR